MTNQQTINLSDNPKTENKHTYQVSLSESQALLFEAIVKNHQELGKSLLPEEFIQMLLDDVILAFVRPGSWEGSNMSTVLESHFPDTHYGKIGNSLNVYRRKLEQNLAKTHD